MRSAKKYLSALSRLSEAARRYDTSLWFQAARARRLHDRSLFSLDEALFWGLTDPSMPSSALDDFLSRESRTRLEARVNSRAANADVDDKDRFHRLCTGFGLRTPAMLGVLRAENPDTRWRAAPGAAYIDVAELPDGEIVAKPIRGMNGRGILFFEKAGRQYAIAGREMDEGGLRQRLQQEAAIQDLIFQRRLSPHPDLASLSGSDSAQCTRIVTYVDDEGRAHVLMARFKIVCGGNSIDNFWTGNLAADVDIDSGRITRVVKKIPGEIGVREVDRHPDTGQPLDICLPAWQEAVRTAVDGALQFKDLRALGWDIALTPEGPVILEANVNWDTFPVAPYRKPSPIGNWESLIR